MRLLTDHIVNPVNDRLKIEVIDEPGFGGGHHRYDITGFVTGGNPAATAGGYVSDFSRLPIIFQNGTIAEVGVNGVTIEALLAIAVDRLRCFQAGPFNCPENAMALGHFEAGLEALKKRTRERMGRGVEGKLEV